MNIPDGNRPAPRLTFSNLDELVPGTAAAVAEFFAPPAVVHTLTLRVERLAAAGQFIADAIVADAHGRQLALQGWRCGEDGLVRYPANARAIPDGWLRRLHPALVAALRLLGPAAARAPQATDVLVRFSGDDQPRAEIPGGARCVPALTRYRICLPHLKRYAWARQFCSGGPVLDAGCGLGGGARLLADSGHTVLALERDPQALALARRRYDTATIAWRPADPARPLPCADNEFQTALALEVVEHLPAAALDGCLRELRRVLRPGGMLVISIPNAEHRERELSSDNQGGLTLADLLASLEQAGLSKVAVHGQQAWRDLPDLLAEADFTDNPEPDSARFIAVASR